MAHGRTSMTRGLDGQTAIVTGAARGIGLGIAARLAADGAQVALWDIDFAPFHGANPGFAPLLTDTVDVTDLDAVERAFARVVGEVGKVEIFVANAGVNGPVMPSWEYTAADWKRVIDTDLTAVWHGMRVALPHMR
ncbi:MAG: SDR family NAD(P)-dependent oxidoreductase, partial [Alphaproteobacteria bacterium]|nr:SDR family NAD(P)-dependent oxidoreductase [Alphaproteobacteria bacterium]